MPGADAGCWTVDYGRTSALPVNGLVWRMWRLNITGGLRKSSGLKASATDRRAASYTGWEGQGLFHIRTVGLIMIGAGWMISVPSGADMMIDL